MPFSHTICFPQTSFSFSSNSRSPQATMQRSMDRSATYNNAGVRLMSAGNHNAALELFRGALESKLSFERRSLSGRDDAPIERCVTPDMSDTEPSSSTSNREELPTASSTLDSYLELSRSTSLSGPQHSPQQSPFFMTFNDGISMSISNAPSTSVGGYEPYLYTMPFAVPEETNGSSLQLTTQAMSCRIVFNLALIHQLVCRSSAKAASFYEIAATLLSSLPDDIDEEIFLLRLVLLNNFGVWCFENAEGESMMACFEQLVETLQNDEMSSISSSIDSSILSGIQRNIEAFLTPVNGVSLAA